VNLPPFAFEQPPATLQPGPRRFPQYVFYRDPQTGICEVETSEPGGPQRATWTTWAPAAPPAPAREPTHTAFEHPGRPGPTEEFQELVSSLRARNDPAPQLQRGEVKSLGT
jgi:hypothetical protein